MRIQAPRGTRDLLPDELRIWHVVEERARELFRLHGYAEIRTPLLEATELFVRGIGEGTDLVSKEMYTFTDRGGRSLTLRPEGTASVVRAYLEHRLESGPQPVKVYYLGPMFRYERPQAGRYRQFHQLGAEVLGTQDPAADAETILIPYDLYQSLGLQGLDLRLNSIGCPNCRPRYREALLDYLRPRVERLCPSHQRNWEANPLRVLDCKSEACRAATAEAPETTAFLCEVCADHFAAVRRYLERLQVPYRVDSRLVRGLDYYTKTVFEITAESLGAQDAVAGGGRYDGLVQELGGPSVPAVGFASGLDRVILTLQRQGTDLGQARPPEVFVAAAGQGVQEAARILAFRLRRAGIAAATEYGDRSLKAQMKVAGRTGAQWVVVVGEAEWAQGQVVLREMATGAQQIVDAGQLIATLTRSREAATDGAPRR
ncbi:MULTISPECIES: histidine--tRNA ligase [Limnochorda]|uniref:histidine--tRNA ligase n=1 Tax=Limnochorda TaxID=1676651 RepID=UPI0017A7FCBE|nr:histidine--tRNA ligase [Limnochorda pilosa]MBO2487077.1 histidine--tRNA ligase [Bacillota bacterium]MBO2519584.1 histidine--tRNA ligase [Bacillota bacterium]NMA71096.1 histidine--tRNA ligase [Bacillota bacterium]